MESLRLSGTSVAQLQIPTSYADEAFTCYLNDTLGATSFSAVATSESNGLLVITLPGHYKKYDGDFEVTLTDSDDNELVSYGVSWLRPYVEPATAVARLGLTMENAVGYERVARMIIDSKTGGFKRWKKSVTVSGSGHDFLPIRQRITKVYTLKENTELLEDGTFSLSDDQTSVIMLSDEDRIDYRPVWRYRSYGTSFPEGFDYELYADFGWQTIPVRIQEACLLLMQDIQCGNNKYMNKFISQYSTDGYSIKFADAMFYSTGNKTVDDLLAGYMYVKEIRPRAL